MRGHGRHGWHRTMWTVICRLCARLCIRYLPMWYWCGEWHGDACVPTSGMGAFPKTSVFSMHMFIPSAQYMLPDDYLVKSRKLQASSVVKVQIAVITRRNVRVHVRIRKHLGLSRCTGTVPYGEFLNRINYPHFMQEFYEDPVPRGLGLA